MHLEAPQNLWHSALALRAGTLLPTGQGHLLGDWLQEVSELVARGFNV